MKAAKTYWDAMVCPKCGNTRGIIRKTSVAGTMVNSYCTHCRKMSIVLAGPIFGGVAR